MLHQARQAHRMQRMLSVVAASCSPCRRTSPHCLTFAFAFHHRSRRRSRLSGAARRHATKKRAIKRCPYKGTPGPEVRFEEIILWQNKVELLLRLRELLSKQPEQVIQVDMLNTMARQLGIVSKTRKVSTFALGFSSVFQFYMDENWNTWCGFTSGAQKLLAEEKAILDYYKPELVVKLRKLLMLACNNRLPVSKIAMLRKYFGFPSDFRESLLKMHPEYFRLDNVKGDLYVELTSWDPSLAVSAIERRSQLEDNGTVKNTLWYPMVFKKGYNPKQTWLDGMRKFHLLPYISPYQHAANFKLEAGSFEAEKFAVGVIHELLSLTIEKQAVVEQLGQFRQEYRLVIPRIMSLLRRHHGIFYALPKKHRSVVFLKEGFKGRSLIEKCPLVQWKERFIKFANVTHSKVC